MVDNLVNSEAVIREERPLDRGLGAVCVERHPVAVTGDIKRELPGVVSAGLGHQRVANGLELRHRQQGGDNVELHELHLLLVRHRVQGARLQLRESIVGRGKNGQTVVEVIELGVDLVRDVGAPHQPQQDAEISLLLEDLDDVVLPGLGRGRWQGRRQRGRQRRDGCWGWCLRWCLS